MGSIPEFNRSLDAMAKSCENITRYISNAGAALQLFAQQAGNAERGASSLSTAVDTATEAAKKAVDPFDEWAKALEKLPMAAEYLRPMMEQFRKEFASGTLDVNQMREAMQKLISQINEWGQGDRRWGDALGLNDLFQQLEKIIALIERAKRGG